MQRPHSDLTFHHLTYFAILCALLLSGIHSQDGGQKKIVPTVDEVFKIIEQGNKEIYLGANRNLVVVMGLTGTGKSTMINFLTGDNSKLIAKMHRKSSVGYIIDDGNKKIGNDDHISKTLYPDLSVDLQTNETMVDCPGFVDTRPYAMEIGASYFTKKVLDFAESVKIIFTIGQSDMTTKGNFGLLLKSATELLPDVSKLHDGFALVVTKVKLENRTEEVEISETVKYLEELKEQISRLRGSEDENRRKRELIEAFLDTKNGNRIALFMKPLTGGPLSKNKMMQDNKRSLRQVIFKNTKYISTKNINFNYTLTADTVGFIRKKINTELITSGETESKFISNQLITTLQNKGKLSTDIFQFHQYSSNLTESFDTYKDITWEDNSMPTFKNLLNLCADFLEESNMDFSYKTDIRNVIEIHNFFKNFTLDIDSPITLWVEPLTDFIEYLQFVNNWYEVLTHIGSQIQAHHVQRNKNVVLGSTLLTQNFGNDIQNLDRYFLHVSDSQLLKKNVQRQLKAETYQRDKEGIRTDKFILRDIRFILNIIGRKAECRNGTLQVQSNFVSLESDVKWAQNNLCEKGNVLSSIEIIAFEKLFIDTDLTYNEGEVHVSIVAPDWEVIGTRKINLNGVNGRDHFKNPEKSKTSHGIDGTVGNPGEPGGSLFAVGFQFWNISHLTFSLVGGNGGRGQDGGMGKDGENGPYPEFHNKYTIKELAKFITEKEYAIYVDNTDIEDSLVYTGLYYVYNSGNPYMRVENIISGTDGWDGGNGGSGGLGAINGTSLIYNLGEENLNVNVIQDEGEEGDSGKGGQGGEAGKGRASIVVNCNFDGRYLLSKEIGKQFTCIITDNRTGDALLSGNDGMDGVGMEGLVQPRMPRKQEISSILHQFRVERVKGSCIDGRKCMLFDNLLRSNDEIMKNIKLPSIVKEIEDIDYNAEQSDSGQIIEYFKGIEILIGKYLKESDAEKYQTFYYFIKQAMSSIQERVQYSERDTITSDFKIYVDGSNRHIEKLLASQWINLLINIKEEVEISVEPTISDLWRMLNTFHKSNLNFLRFNLNTITKKGIDDVGITKTKDVNNFNNSKVIKNIVVDHIKNSAVLEFVNKMGDMVQFLGNLFCVLAKGVSKDADISTEDFEDSSSCQTASAQNLINNADLHLQSFLKDTEPKTDSTILLTEKFYSYIDSFLKCDVASDETEGLDGYLDAVLEPTFPETGSSEEKDESSRKTALLPDNPPRDLNTIKDCLLTKKQSDLKVINAFTFLNFLYSKEAESDIVIDLISQFNNIHIIIPIIEAANSTFSYYENSMKFKSDARLYFYPFMATLKSLVKKNTEAIDSRSFVLKQSIREHITSSLDRVYNFIKSFVKNMKPMDNYRSTFSKLEEFRNIINTFLRKIDRLTSSKSQNSEFTKFEVNLNNQYFAEEIQTLVGVIKRNEILKQFKTIVNQYVMATFPLARIHLEVVNSELNYEKGVKTDELFATTQKIIQQFQTAIYAPMPSIRSKRQKILKLAMFSASKSQSAPFFAWKSKSYEFDIDNFLTGKEVLLNADITQSVLKNIIRFQSINLKISLARKHSEDVSPEMLQNALLDFDVELTHMGNSKYKCDTKYYIVRGESVTFRYSLAQHADREPLRSNEEYKRMLLKEIKLSPYAMWRMRLISVSLSDASFSVLDKFKGQVNLELEGGAFYAEPNSKICYSKLNTFYEEYDPLDFP